MCQDAGEKKNNNPEIPFSFILQKPVSERHRRKALTPSFHLLKSLWFKAVCSDVWDGQCGSLSLPGWGEQPQDRRQGSIWLSTGKTRNQWWGWCGGACQQALEESKRLESEVPRIKKTKLRVSIRDGWRRLTLCLVSAIWSLASEDSQQVSLLSPDWKLIVSAFSLQPEHKTHTHWRRKKTKQKEHHFNERRFICLSPVFISFWFSPLATHYNANTAANLILIISTVLRVFIAVHSAVKARRRGSNCDKWRVGCEQISVQVAAFLQPLQLFFFNETPSF